jgi:hypothetical protein
VIAAILVLYVANWLFHSGWRGIAAKLAIYGIVGLLVRWDLLGPDMDASPPQLV